MNGQHHALRQAVVDGEMLEGEIKRVGCSCRLGEARALKIQAGTKNNQNEDTMNEFVFVLLAHLPISYRKDSLELSSKSLTSKPFKCNTRRVCGCNRHDEEIESKIYSRAKIRMKFKCNIFKNFGIFYQKIKPEMVEPGRVNSLRRSGVFSEWCMFRFLAPLFVTGSSKI
jgi:hypothetical protein